MVYDNEIVFNNYDVLYTAEKSQKMLFNENIFEKKIFSLLVQETLKRHLSKFSK